MSEHTVSLLTHSLACCCHQAETENRKLTAQLHGTSRQLQIESAARKQATYGTPSWELVHKLQERLRSLTSQYVLSE